MRKALPPSFETFRDAALGDGAGSDDAGSGRVGGVAPESLPDLVIEIERVVAADEVLTPYLWVSGVDNGAFERATEPIRRSETSSTERLQRGHQALIENTIR